MRRRKPAVLEGRQRPAAGDEQGGDLEHVSPASVIPRVPRPARPPIATVGKQSCDARTAGPLLRRHFDRAVRGVSSLEAIVRRARFPRASQASGAGGLMSPLRNATPAAQSSGRRPGLARPLWPLVPLAGCAWLCAPGSWAWQWLIALETRPSRRDLGRPRRGRAHDLTVVPACDDRAMWAIAAGVAAAIQLVGAGWT